ncbi:MAG: 1-deoxy-D-xylulose-5-phosphate synthase [Flavobacteriaceae bacterium]|nr:1-deoxy-D-xylulose-5-phosphate synthase [Flavobacteriaceae bacterium]MDG1912555.1 1-deoxy-D-xylulose-5-phosphate synthase [Flavobacteriaceae bacterium]
MSENRFASIQNPEELRRLSKKELPDFATALRKEIIHALAKGEGHLGSSLGTVELTVALHYCFDTPKDVLIWDVGHQAYGHKMLTGRKAAFDHLRQEGGISGFPKREESLYDAFGTGHAGTAISAALGMALSSTLKGENKQHIAVVGDASIANGMAFEALNHLGTTQANVLVILNDNTMGIDPSVGALKHYFETVKKEHPDTPNFFESLNLDYSGPIDGHNMKELLQLFDQQKKIQGPRIIHLVTTKGKGLPIAENEQVTYHAPGKFDPLTGKLSIPQAHQKLKFQDVFGQTLLHLAKTNEKIIALTPAMPTGSGLVKMMDAFPSRCIDVGIAEQHAVTLAAGMAAEGMLPFCVIYSTFLQRAYDQVIHDVALQNLSVVFCIDRAGIVGHDGPTHHGVFDIAFLRCIPNLEIATPRDAQTLQNLLYTAQLGIKHPLAIRYPRGFSEQTKLTTQFEKINWGKGQLLKEGTKLAVLSFGTLAKVVSETLKNIEETNAIAHYDMCFVKPIDEELLHTICKTFKAIIVFEEGSSSGGAGSAILEFAAQQGYHIPIQLEGIPDQFISHGNTLFLHEKLGWNAEGISKKISLLLNKIE